MRGGRKGGEATGVPKVQKEENSGAGNSLWIAICTVYMTVLYTLDEIGKLL